MRSLTKKYPMTEEAKVAGQNTFIWDPAAMREQLTKEVTEQHGPIDGGILMVFNQCPPEQRQVEVTAIFT